ncbi:MAG TPA: hypothetical protein PLS29_04785 [Acidimicrobiales bacterium]|nr:MAG: hypothetical protein B7Z69_02210 [Actinobacteria bacterium 21-73-9]HQU26331.1 hypothetical protein [Acidimicrobiales bacterium]
MDDLDHRLRAADPVAGQPYRVPERIVARVVAERRPGRVVRPFAWKMAAAAAASAALTVGGVSALGQVAPAFAALEVAAVVPPPPSAGPTDFATANGVVVPGADGAPALHLAPDTSAPPSIEVTRLTHPADLAAEARRLARVLGVTGPTVRVGAVPASWQVGRSPGAVVVVVGGAVPQWSYSSSSPSIAPATRSAGPVRSAAERDGLRERAARLLARLGLGLTLGRATYVDAIMDGATPNDVYREVTATFVVTHAGLPTDQRVVLGVDARGRLVFAAGPDVTAARDVPYALESPAAALGSLRGGVGPASGGPAASPRPSVVRATLGLRAFVVRGGATWWLPVYTFTTHSGAHWQVLARASGEVTIAPHATGLDVRGVVVP